ncbi:hypothetical protein ABH945_006824 [Paraburkholderia sp. GAS333]
MELSTLRDWIYDVLRVRAERHWRIQRVDRRK